MSFRPRVLVVDDDAFMLELLAEGVTRSGAEPRRVQSSLEAAELINTEKFEGIFLDWIMPGMNGLELAREVRYSKSNSLCPLVMVTGNIEPGAMSECFRAGITFFLWKPMSIEQIQKVAENARDLMLLEWLRYQRVPIQITVICTAVQSMKQPVVGESVDLSTTGMRLRLDPTPAASSMVHLRFSLPGDSEPLEVTAMVIRVASDGLIGVRLINLAPRERSRLTEFSKSHLEAADAVLSGVPPRES